MALEAEERVLPVRRPSDHDTLGLGALVVGSVVGLERRAVVGVEQRRGPRERLALELVAGS